MSNVDNPFKSPVVISLCPGILGLERGIERAIQSPLRVAAYSEIEAFICANLIAGMEAGVLAPAPIWSNLKTFPFDKFRGKIHGITGGYPCQPFSQAGKRRGAEDPRHLWPYIAKGIQAAQPIWCFFENVENHLNIGYETVRAELEGLGYRVKEGIFSSAEIGAPHQRKRLFILAIKLPQDHQGYSGEGVDQVNPFGNDEGRCSVSGLSPELNEASEGNKEGWNELGDSESQCSQYAGGSWEGISRSSNDGSDEGYLQGKLSNSSSKGLSGQSGRSAKSQITEPRFGDSDLRPSRPGQPQQAWECPRVLSRQAESDVGLSVNGYNFREDLLRALGNSVDEWVAAKAFKVLLMKHGIEL